MFCCAFLRLFKSLPVDLYAIYNSLCCCCLQRMHLYQFGELIDLIKEINI